MATKQQALRVIKALGAALDESTLDMGYAKACDIDAPEGAKWEMSGCSLLSVCEYDVTAGEFWDEVISQVQEGLYVD